MEDALNKPLLTWGQSRVGGIGGPSGLALILLAVSSSIHAAALHDPQEVFPQGERLVYQVRWDPPSWAFFLPPVNAGELTFQVHPPRVFEGQQVSLITVDP